MEDQRDSRASSRNSEILQDCLMTTPETLLAATRYEKVRKLNPREYSELWNDCIINDIQFDDAIDALPEPFRASLKEEPKTCQTCKHWVPDTARIDKSLATSMGKCKEIFEKLTTFDGELEGYLPFFESFITESNFGCNGYEQAKGSL